MPHISHSVLYGLTSVFYAGASVGVEKTLVSILVAIVYAAMALTSKD